MLPALGMCVRHGCRTADPSVRFLEIINVRFGYESKIGHGCGDTHISLT